MKHPVLWYICKIVEIILFVIINTDVPYRTDLIKELNDLHSDITEELTNNGKSK